MSKADRAEELFAMSGLNCAQAVVCAFSEELGMDADVLAKMAASFGGGIARTGEICGAASGMCMLAGLLCSKGINASAQDKAAHYAIVRELLEEFKKKHGSIICRELLKSDKKLHSCATLVRDAAGIVEDKLINR